MMLDPHPELMQDKSPEDHAKGVVGQDCKQEKSKNWFCLSDAKSFASEMENDPAWEAHGPCNVWSNIRYA